MLNEFSDDDDKDGVDPIALLNQLIEQQPGAILLKDLSDVEAIHIYGKTLTIRCKNGFHSCVLLLVLNFVIHLSLY